jgi:hypothetical protein
MLKRLASILGAVVSLFLALSVAGCAASDPTPSDSPYPSINPALIPSAAPADAAKVAKKNFDDKFGIYAFKAGTGSAWCSIDTKNKFVICEQNEADAMYAPIPAPSDCYGSFGYQLELDNVKPAKSDIAHFNCSGSYYTDPSNLATLADHQKLEVAGFTCWVKKITARCDNSSGNYIALGPDAWALGN